MVLDESTLRAFVDGELDPPAREKAEAIIAHSPALQAQVAALRASCLPFRTAFEQQPLPPVPAGLAQRVASLAAVAQASRGGGSPAPAGLSRRHWLGFGASLAASFLLGAALPWHWRLGHATPTHGMAGQAWVDAIANYQALYVRETLEQGGESPTKLQSLLGGFGTAQRTALFVPDLRKEGLQFRRVQRLGYGPLPLIQMVFLPVSGKPLALCALPTGEPDSPIEVRRHEGLAVASWQRRGLAYVLAADMPQEALRRLAAQLQAGAFPPA